MSYLSLYLIGPDGGCIDDNVPDGDVPNGGYLLLSKDPVPAVLKPEAVAVTNPFKLIDDNVPK
jgi:hypothetical protein